MVYDPNKPYTYESIDEPNLIVRKWKGELRFKVLDIDYSKYALLYLCQQKYFGLKTEESVYVMTRGLILDSASEGRINNVFKRFNYGGKALIRNEQDPAICKQI